MLPKRPASTILDFFNKSKIQKLPDDTSSAGNDSDTTNETPVLVLPEQSAIHISKSSIETTDENNIFESSNDCLPAATIEENVTASDLLQSIENKDTQSSCETDNWTYSQRLSSCELSTTKSMFARIKRKKGHVLSNVACASSKNENL
jgi:hypothetical protein